MQSAAIDTALGFARAEHVVPDDERPGLLRAKTMPSGEDPRSYVAPHACAIRDVRVEPDLDLGLDTTGFDRTNLETARALLAVLDRVRTTSVLTPADARSIRASLRFRSLSLRSGARYRVLFVASEGTILRLSAPNGVPVRGVPAASAISGHESAASVHTDQDVLGTPVKQWLLGLAPFLFHHDAPDSRNARSRLFIANVWIPLQQPTRPLALADGRSIDRRRHQLRYALPTESFLDRGRGTKVNDVWAMLPDPGQRWYFASEPAMHEAWVFDTLSTPHGACSLPGEDVAGQVYTRLADVVDAAARGDAQLAGSLARAATGDVVDSSAGPALVAGVSAMRACLAEVARSPEAALASGFAPRARAALDSVVRKSIELRTVGFLRGRPKR